MKRHRFTNSTGILTIRESDSGGLYQSMLERNAFIRELMDPEVKRVRLQEPRINYSDALKKRHRYTADLLVEYHSALRRPKVVEVKYTRELVRKPELREKFIRLKSEFALHSQCFEVVTESEIYAPGFPMMRFIFDYRNNQPTEVDQAILSITRRHAEITLGEILSAVCGDARVARLQVATSVWRLVATKQLTVDFKEILDETAKVSVSPVHVN